MFTSLKRMLLAGFTHFYRHAFVSLAAVLVMAVTLFTIGGAVFLSALLSFSLEELKERVDVNVYFQTAAPEGEILALAERLRTLPEVKDMQYISRDEALRSFKERHADDALTLQALAELPDNPLGAVLNIRAKEPSQYEGIATFLKGDHALGAGASSIIDEVNYYDNKQAIDRLARIIDSAEALSLGVTVVLIAVSIIIALSTIRLAIYTSREEIGVMRLVGASNTYIRGPFVIAGVLYGAFAALITLIALYPATFYLGGATENFFGGLNIFRYYLTHWSEFVLIIGGAGAALGAVSSFLAVRRYLNV